MSSNRKSHQKVVDRLVLMAAVLLVIFILVIGFQSGAFAQKEGQLRETAGNIVDTLMNWIFQTVDESTENMEIPENPLNFTDEEARNLIESGKKTGSAGVELIREAHHLSENAAEGLLPWDINPDIIFLLALIVIGIIAVKRHKTLTKDIVYIALGIVILVVIFTILQLNLS